MNAAIAEAQRAEPEGQVRVGAIAVALDIGIPPT